MVRREGLLSLTGIALLGLIVLMTLHEWDYAMPRSDRERQDLPTMVLEGVQAVSHQADGAPEYQVHAGSITYFEASQRSELVDPRVQLYGGRGQWLVSARRGEMDQEHGVMELNGEVRARRQGEQPLLVETGHLVYDVDGERILIPGPARIEHQGGWTRTGRLEANLREGVLIMHEGVETRYAPVPG